MTPYGNSDDERGTGSKRKRTQKQKDRQATITRQIEAAVQHYEENIEPDQVKALDYFFSRPYGDEKEDRSKVVTSEVRDTIRQMMPTLMRIFYGPRRIAEFMPREPADILLAEQMTEAVLYIIREQNGGFMTVYSAFKNALRERVGVFKWWWEAGYCRKGSRHTGLNEEQLAILAADEDVKEVRVIGTSEVDGTIEAELVREEKQGRVHIAALPPEEFGYSPDARDMETAAIVYHRREMPAGDLIAMGIDKEVVDRKKGRTPVVHEGQADIARSLSETSDNDDDEDEGDPSQAAVLYTEAYARVEGEDGATELRKFECVGDDYEIVNGNGDGELVDEVPFGVITPDPEPHTMTGQGIYDDVGPLQRINSQLWRGTLDSMAQSIHPLMEVLENEVNIGDLMQASVSGFYRVRKSGAVTHIKTPFVGGDTLPLIQELRSMREERSGMSKASNGLDADALQSTTKAAVTATLSAAQARLELIARVFAETGFLRMMKGVAKLIIQHQDRPFMVRLRNQYVEVDPRHWKADMDVAVNVALGQGPPEDQAAALGQTVGVLREMQQMGVPYVTNVEVRRAVAKTIEYAQLGLPEEFIKPWGEEQEAQMQQQRAQQPPAQDPQMALVEVEKWRAQQDIQLQQMKLEIDRQKIAMEDDRERDKMAQEFALKERELELKYATQIHDVELTAQVAQRRAEMDAEVKKAAAAAPAATA